MKIQAVPLKKTEAEEIQSLTKQTQTALQNSSRELSHEEKLIIQEAKALSVQEFPIIYPMQGTIGRMTRNLDGGNHQAIELIRAGIPTMSMKTGSNNLLDLIIAFDKLDEASQNRIDCLDHLARKNRVAISRFLDAMTEGLDFISRRETAIIVANKRPDLARKILKSAQDESLKSVAHKKLAANMAGLETGRESPVKIEIGDRTTNNTQINQNVVLSFSEFSKMNNKLIRGKEEEKKDFVEGEIINE